MSKKEKTNFLFSPFNSNEEYMESFRSINVKLNKNDRFEFLVFVERLRSTMLSNLESATKTESED